jgi:DNA-binding transcriptional LysR family regulator
MNFYDLEALVAIVDYGSVVGAAAGLHVTQSAITRRLRSLEDALGVPLLDHKTRPLQPTRAGLETYTFAKQVLNSVSDLKAAFVDDGEPSGGFRLGVARSLSGTILTESICCLRAEYPKLIIQAFSRWSGPLIDQITNRTLDAAAVLLPPGETPPPTLIGEYLGTESFTVVAAKNSPVPPSSTLHDLSSYGWIANPNGCGTRRTMESALAAHRLPYKVAVEVEGHELQLALVAQGVGLALVMPQVFRASEFRKQLKVVKVADFIAEQAVWIVHASHIGRLASVIETLRGVVKRSLHLKSNQPELIRS